MKKNIHFVLAADKGFENHITRGIDQINFFYPKSKIWLYDLSQEEGPNLSYLSKKYENINYKSWPPSIWNTKDWYSDLRYMDILKVYQKQRIGLVDDLREILRRLYLPLRNWNTKKNITTHFIFKNRLFSEKVFILLDASQVIGDKFIYLDGDAYLINRIDDLFDSSYDIGVTSRRYEEFSFERNNVRVLNGGVVVFNTNSSRSGIFIKEWIKTMKEIPDLDLNEQTALTRLLEKHLGREVFSKYGSIHELSFQEEDRLLVKILPCDIYNFNWIEEGIDHDKVKIIHFKSGRSIADADKILIKSRSIKN